MSNASVIGAYHTAFGAFTRPDRETGALIESKGYYDLLWEAARGAIEDAGLEPKDIDGIWLGTAFPEGFVDQAHPAPLALEIDPALRFVPTQRLEGACASSSVALYNAIYAVESGRFKRALVLGVEKMTSVSTQVMTALLARASYWPEEGAVGLTAPGMFAAYAQAYQAHYQISDAALRRAFAHVSALGYRNGAKNPLAHFGPGGLAERKGLLTAEAILALPDEGPGANAVVAAPLRLHDCSLVSDGAAAVVIAPRGAVAGREVHIAGIGQTTEVMRMGQRAQLYRHDAGIEAARRAYTEAGITAAAVEAAE
ncbi:hypothetical protein KKB55_01910, partial [Myxococcota bacterium]|nr:hypothetical protein [Myxococcota bacterium]